MRMRIYPAIDIRDGNVVRLTQGDFARETVYAADPVEAAARFQAEGAEALHVVDLDGAKDGRPRHLDLLERICHRTGLPVQFGGGLRGQDSIDAAVAAGAARVVLGTAALQPGFVAAAVARHGERIVVGLDARDGRVAVRGWQESAALDVADAAQRMREQGCREIVYTDIGRDGMLAGPDIAGLERLLGLGLAVVASGGIASGDDIRRLAELVPLGLTGAIIGRALYTGDLTLPAALAAVREGGSENAR